MSNESQVSDIDDTPVSTPAAEAKTKTSASGKRSVKVDGFDIALSGKKKTVTIHESDAEGGRDAVAIGLNGYMYQVPRGIPVEVPEELVSILENAKTSTYHPAGPGTTELIERVFNRFAFSTH